MRLIDQILQASPATNRLSMGMVGEMADFIRTNKPQCYEISEDVVEAADQVFKSKPSSILAALSYARFPYDYAWIERVFVPGSRDPNHPNNNKPPPKRVGCLICHTPTIESPKYSCGIASWAWSFSDEHINVSPFSVLFDYSFPINDQEFSSELVHYIRSHNKARWHAHSNEPGQMEAVREIAAHSGTLACPFSSGFWSAIGFKDLDSIRKGMLERQGHQKAIFDSLMADIAGEDTLVTGFLIMLNSKNAITKESESLEKLNKSRARRGRQPLTEFIKTSLTIPRHLYRSFGSSTSDRAAARMHMVSGHYKVRKSGVYWWSPHPRGKGSSVEREQYTVKRG